MSMDGAVGCGWLPGKQAQANDWAYFKAMRSRSSGDVAKGDRPLGGPPPAPFARGFLEAMCGVREDFWDGPRRVLVAIGGSQDAFSESQLQEQGGGTRPRGRMGGDAHGLPNQWAIAGGASSMAQPKQGQTQGHRGT